MKAILIWLLAIFYIVAPWNVRAAETLPCAHVVSHDARIVCLAKVRHTRSACYAVRDHALRMQCLADVHE